MQVSICKISVELDEVNILPYEILVECIMASAPSFTHTPNRSLGKKSFATKFASLAKHLAISLLKNSPTAIGQIAPLFFNKPNNDALQRACELNSGSLHGSLCLPRKRYTVQHAKVVREIFLKDQLL